MTPGSLENTYCSDLQCYVRFAAIDPETGHGLLHTYGDSAPDMDACIERFTSMKNGVTRIDVVTTVGPETSPILVFRIIDEEWQAREYRCARRQRRSARH